MEYTKLGNNRGSSRNEEGVTRCIPLTLRKVISLHRPSE